MCAFIERFGTMNGYIWLDSLQNGESGVVRQINNVGGIRKRLLDIGLTENTVIKCVGTSPMGDPKAYLFRGAVMAIRKQDGSGVLVEKQCGGSE